eukprot:10732524-Ditylum_brightwellii.AAC.2
MTSMDPITTTCIINISSVRHDTINDIRVRTCAGLPDSTDSTTIGTSTTISTGTSSDERADDLTMNLGQQLTANALNTANIDR